jgi:hypothetical protein
MKICTACNTTYSDDLNFCLVDGTTLTPEKSLSSNQPFSYNPNNWSDAETPTQVSNRANFTQQNPQPPPTVASFSPPPSYVPQNFSSVPPTASSNRGLMFAIVAGAAIFGVIVVVGIIIAANWNKPTDGSNNSITSRNSAANTTVNNAVTVSNTKVNSNSSSTSNSNTNEANTTTSPKFDFVGTWKGKFDKDAASLNITSQSGETFSGTLLTKGYTVEITGQVNSAKRTVSIRETKVLKTPAGSNWNLGKDDGTISENGKTMSGTGRDKNISYTWSFTKQ